MRAGQWKSSIMTVSYRRFCHFISLAAPISEGHQMLALFSHCIHAVLYVPYMAHPKKGMQLDGGKADAVELAWPALLLPAPPPVPPPSREAKRVDWALDPNLEHNWRQT